MIFWPSSWPRKYRIKCLWNEKRLLIHQQKLWTKSKCLYFFRCPIIAEKLDIFRKIAWLVFVFRTLKIREESSSTGVHRAHKCDNPPKDSSPFPTVHLSGRRGSGITHIWHHQTKVVGDGIGGMNGEGEEAGNGRAPPPPPPSQLNLDRNPSADAIVYDEVVHKTKKLYGSAESVLVYRFKFRRNQKYGVLPKMWHFWYVNLFISYQLPLYFRQKIGLLSEFRRLRRKPWPGPRITSRSKRC